jgi:hypothetical protein
MDSLDDSSEYSQGVFKSSDSSRDLIDALFRLNSWLVNFGLLGDSLDDSEDSLAVDFTGGRLLLLLYGVFSSSNDLSEI